MSTRFADLKLSSLTLKALEESGYTQPTAIQATALPPALEGRDVLATAPTGTGKTAAYVLPALQKLMTPRPSSSSGPRVLVLTPTRELAQQVHKAVTTYSKYKRIKVGTIIGGTKYFEQNKFLSGYPDFVVGTPGRLLDQKEQKRLDLSSVEMVILDEADRMLDMGFRDAVEELVLACPTSRQTLMFTATLDAGMAKLANRLLKDPVRVNAEAEKKTKLNIDQRLVLVNDHAHKVSLIDHILANEGLTKAIIFTATKREADRLARELRDKDHKAAALHGGLHQGQRNRTLKSLHEGKIYLLVATDVAARGIHVADISHVINFDLPKVAEDYVHRIGRTGRAGATGTAWSFASRQDRGLVRDIERYTGQAIPVHTVAGLEASWNLSSSPAPAHERRPGKPFKGRPQRSFQGKKPFRDKPFRRDERDEKDRPTGSSPRGDRPQRPFQGKKPFRDKPFRKDAQDAPADSSPRSDYSQRPFQGKRPFRSKPFRKDERDAPSGSSPRRGHSQGHHPLRRDKKGE